MYRAVSAEQSRAIEQRAVEETGTTLVELMREAGAAIAREVMTRVPDGVVLVVAGPGNNGGDGWVAARELVVAGRRVHVAALKSPTALGGAAADAAAVAVAAGVEWSAGEPPTTGLQADVIVDAVLGTGVELPLRETASSWCRAINAADAYVISVDVPTGVSSDSGACSDDAVRADCTITFTTPKRGHFMYPGAGVCGEIVVADIGIPHSMADIEGAPEVWTPDEYASLVRIPAPDAHKNNRGRVLVVAGSRRFAGAAVLAARGAMRAGAGYVTVAVPDPVVSVVQAHLAAAPVIGLPSSRTGTFTSSAGAAAVDLARDYDAVVLGPGLTLADGAVTTARRIFTSVKAPLVVDADALNALMDALDLFDARPGATVLTPHPGELGRLLGVSVGDVQSDRVFSAARLARANRAVVLKGAGTVTSNGERCVINSSGSFALATAGTGDVLSGVIGTLLAHGLDVLEAGALGAHLHGRAGELAAADLTPLCVTAEDVPEYLPAAFGEILGSW